MAPLRRLRFPRPSQLVGHWPASRRVITGSTGIRPGVAKGAVGPNLSAHPRRAGTTATRIVLQVVTGRGNLPAITEPEQARHGGTGQRQRCGTRAAVRGKGGGGGLDKGKVWTRETATSCPDFSSSPVPTSRCETRARDVRPWPAPPLPRRPAGKREGAARRRRRRQLRYGAGRGHVSDWPAPRAPSTFLSLARHPLGRGGPERLHKQGVECIFLLILHVVLFVQILHVRELETLKDSSSWF